MYKQIGAGQEAELVSPPKPVVVEELEVILVGSYYKMFMGANPQGSMAERGEDRVELWLLK